MAQEVMIKSTKYGIHLILDPELPFGDLLRAVAVKFAEAAKFFGKSKLAVSFEGRDLSQGESFRLIETITAHTEVTVLCIVDEDQQHADLFKQQIDEYYASIEGKDGEFYRGNLRNGQTLSSETNLILAGDVQPGASVSAKGNILIMGALCGSAHAGCDGTETAFVTALSMEPEKLRIANVTAYTPQKKAKSKKPWQKDKAPVAVQVQIARINGRDIEIMTMPKLADA